MFKSAKPLGDRVLLKLEDKTETKSSGGILLNTSTQQIQNANVVAVSPGYVGPMGNLINLSVNVGDNVLINNGAGQKVRIDGNDYYLVKEHEILMILNYEK